MLATRHIFNLASSAMDGGPLALGAAIFTASFETALLVAFLTSLRRRK